MLTAAMGNAGVRRLVITSAYPIVRHRPRLPMALLRRIFAAAYADAMEQHLETADLDWTIVRLNRLTDQPGRGNLILSRGLLDLAETNHHARTAVNVSTSSQ